MKTRFRSVGNLICWIIAFITLGGALGHEASWSIYSLITNTVPEGYAMRFMLSSIIAVGVFLLGFFASIVGHCERESKVAVAGAILGVLGFMTYSGMNIYPLVMKLIKDGFAGANKTMLVTFGSALLGGLVMLVGIIIAGAKKKPTSVGLVFGIVAAVICLGTVAGSVFYFVRTKADIMKIITTIYGHHDAYEPGIYIPLYGLGSSILCLGIGIMTFGKKEKPVSEEPVKEIPETVEPVEETSVSSEDED